MESGDTLDVETGSRADRVGELRANLTARLDAETLLAEAGATRQAAVRDADRLLAEAQQAAADLTSDSRREVEQRAARARAEADAVVASARADAEVIRNRAEADVEDYRRRVRDELTHQLGEELAERTRADLVSVREQSEAMIGDLAASVRILGVALETAQANVTEMLAALDELRVHAVEGLGAPGRAGPAAVEALGHADDGENAADAGVLDDIDTDTDADDDPPVTAMDAYLRSVHIDFGDPALPPVDDTEVGARYARDAERRRDRDVTDGPGHATAAPGAGDDAEGAGAGSENREKPLGWLFRSTS